MVEKGGESLVFAGFFVVFLGFFCCFFCFFFVVFLDFFVVFFGGLVGKERDSKEEGIGWVLLDLVFWFGFSLFPAFGLLGFSFFFVVSRKARLAT